MKFLLVLSLLILTVGKETNDGDCSSYRPVSDIKECFDKQTGKKHFSCCGLNIKKPDSSQLSCRSFPSTKASREFYRIALAKNIESQGGTLDVQCPNGEDEIQGTCEDWSEIMVNNQKDCLKLSESETNNTCCGLKTMQTYSKQGDKLPANICYGLPINKNERDKAVKKFENETEGHIKVENYYCQGDPEPDTDTPKSLSEYHIKNLKILIFFCLLLL